MNNKNLALLISIVAIIAVVALAFGFNRNSQNSYAKFFIEKTTVEELKAIISNVDYLILGNKQSFESVQELSLRGIFNLYASTKEVQDKIDALSNNLNYIEIPLSDVQNFVKQYFGNYPFDPEKLISEENVGDRIKYDKNLEILYLSGVSGGVNAPSAMPYELAIDSVKANGEKIIIEATCHSYDNSSFSSYDKINLTLNATNDGFNYVSYNSKIMSQIERTDTYAKTAEEAMKIYKKALLESDYCTQISLNHIAKFDENGQDIWNTIKISDVNVISEDIRENRAVYELELNVKEPGNSAFDAGISPRWLWLVKDNNGWYVYGLMTSGAPTPDDNWWQKE